MVHDFEQQRRDTHAVWKTICDKKVPPKSAVLNLQFLPLDGNANWDRFSAGLTAAGYANCCYEDDDTVEVSIGIAELNADTIWEHELATTKIALECGFYPDGWGFLSNNGVKS